MPAICWLGTSTAKDGRSCQTRRLRLNPSPQQPAQQCQVRQRQQLQQRHHLVRPRPQPFISRPSPSRKRSTSLLNKSSLNTAPRSGTFIRTVRNLQRLLNRRQQLLPVSLNDPPLKRHCHRKRHQKQQRRHNQSLQRRFLPKQYKERPQLSPPDKPRQRSHPFHPHLCFHQPSQVCLQPSCLYPQ